MGLLIFSITSQSCGEVEFTEIIPDVLQKYLIPGASPIVAYCSSGYLLFQEIRGEDHSVWHTTILLHRDDRFFICAREPLLALHFFLQHNFLMSRELTQEPIVFHEGEYNMSFLSPFAFITEFLKGQAYSCLTLSYSPDYLARVAATYPQMGELFEKANRHAVAYLCPNNKLITEEMKRSVHTLLYGSCKEEETRKIIQKGKVLEILVQVLEQAGRDDALIRPLICQKDVEKIYTAKEYMEENFSVPITLFQLAKKVGMNVHKLSTGFLQVTGSTVFCYHRQVRMNKAMRLLEETDRNLFDIGTEVGYIDGKCFSKEFKKELGVTPFEYRKQKKLQSR